MQKAQPYLIGTLFVIAGALHFRSPHRYETIVPPYLPAPKTLVAVSGLFEVLGGLGVAIPATRRFSGWGLIVLLVAVLPANVYMATARELFSNVAPAWVLSARIPLQFVVMWWIYRTCVREL